MKHLIFILIIIFNINLYSQGSTDLSLVGEGPRSNPGSLINFNASKLNGSFQFIDNNLLKKTDNIDMKGSFYLYNTWTNRSSIITKNNKKYNLLNLNFDLDIEKFVSKTSKDSIFIFTGLKEIKIAEKKFTKIEDRYFELVIDQPEKTSFLKNYSGKLKKAVLNKMTNQQLRPAQFNKVTKHYLLVESKLTEIKLKKKSILKNINAKYQSEIKKYAKLNKLSYKKEIDIIKIINYYNKISQL